MACLLLYKGGSSHHAAILAIHIAASCDSYSLILEVGALNVILAINEPQLFVGWNFASTISEISFYLLSFNSWRALKVSINANVKAHNFAKWVASHIVYGSIPSSSPFSLPTWCINFRWQFKILTLLKWHFSQF